VKKPGCVLLVIVAVIAPAVAQAELFDFDSAPIHAPLPLDLTVGGVTAHFSATGQGYAIQPANTMGFTPAGFGGLCIYPSSVFASDLLVDFSVRLTGFSIMFSPQELGYDDSATLRVTAYRNGGPSFWPTTCSSPLAPWLRSRSIGRQ
jgi:hypothetical protein